MASQNAFTLKVDFSGPDWAGITEAQKKAALKVYAERIVARKHWELDRALDAESGQKMPARQKPRDDGADGPVLTPHGRQSRSHRYIRTSLGKSHVTVWWSHGWGTVLGYHADGVVIGAYKRDVIGLTPAGERKVARELLDWWRRTRKSKPKPAPKVGPAGKPPVPQRAVGRAVTPRPLPPPPVPMPVKRRDRPQPRP